MFRQSSMEPRQVLIVSSHPLFGKGIQHLLQSRQAGDVRVIGIVANVEDAINALDLLKPDLVVVDYDDDAVNRDEFLARFMESKHQLRVVLLSLKEGGSNAVVYDRRNLEASQIEDWLEEWTETEQENSKIPDAKNFSVSIYNKKTKEDRRNVMKNVPPILHGVFTAVIVALLAVIGLFVLRTDLLLPKAASTQAGPIDFLFRYHFILIAFLFALIVGIILYSAIAFRRSPGEEDPTYEKGDASLNITWIIFPLTTVFAYVIFEMLPSFRELFARILPDHQISFDLVAIIASVVVGLIIYFVIFPPGRGSEAHEETAKENGKLEITWTAIPLVFVLGLSFIGSDALAKTMRMDPKALEIKVIGRQWAWSFEYPGYGITSTDLVMPVNKQVLLRLTSEDVIHAFWVPEFRVKQDAVPGTFKELRVTPTDEKEFMLMCAEICGTRHAYMTAKVVVMSQEGFDQWIKGQQIPSDPVGRGQYWYKQQGCIGCHSIDGSKIVGPSFKGLFGREDELIDGGKVVADEAYIAESITNPYAKIVSGYELSPGSGTSAMPNNFSEKLSTEQINEIIEWIKTLK